MKKLIIASVLFMGTSLAWSQETQNNTLGEYTGHAQCTNFFKTPQIRDLISNLDLTTEENGEIEIKDQKSTNWDIVTDKGIPENNGIDAALQTEGPIYRGTNQNREAVNFNGLTSSSYPPDPSGAAGQDYFVQAINSSYRVYNKDGSAASSAFSLSSLWTGSSNDGDPIVMYDRYAERWFISQFQASSPYEILIAISETSDPLGSYYAYTFTFSSLPDYPKFGVWPNGYYMSANTGSNNCVVFEREKMLLGDNTASMITMTFPTMQYFFRSYAPAYAEGPTEPEADEPFYFFHVQDDSWTGVSEDHIKVIKCDVDWDTPSNSSVSISQSITTDAFNTVFTNNWDDITQKGTTQKLDAVAGIFMYRAQYIRFSDHNTVMLCHAVDVDNTNRAGMRWYELREDNDGVWYIYQQSTYSPDSDNSRWMGSVTMDKLGNIAMAYCFAGSDNYAGIRYTGRFADDPLNQMTVEEQIAIEGAGSQTVANRYGDYSQMSLDPEDDWTFWFTGEYLGSGGSRRSRIFSFSSWHLLGEEDNEIENEFINAFQPNANQLTINWYTSETETISLELYEVNGKLIMKELVDPTIGTATYDVPTAANGIYFVKLNGKTTTLTKKVFIS